jgi:hypothetical protein
MFRLAWRSPKTGLAEKGTALFASAETAREVASVMTILWPGTDHWIEPAEECGPTCGAVACAMVAGLERAAG